MKDNMSTLINLNCFEKLEVWFTTPSVKQLISTSVPKKAAYRYSQPFIKGCQMNVKKGVVYLFLKILCIKLKATGKYILENLLYNILQETAAFSIKVFFH